MKLFFLVLALGERHLYEKVEELKRLHAPFLVVCGKNLKHESVVFREPIGKYDAINYGMSLVPKDVDVVALNDVDTKIFNFEAALNRFSSANVSLLFVRVSVKQGPQNFFYPILDTIRRRVPINASGELLLVRRDVLEDIVPLNPCKAEDSYILFKVLESKRKVAFCEECYVVTERTKTAKNEEAYKRKTVCGIYQALSQSNPPFLIKLFYFLLPVFSPLLLVIGKKGYYWMRGIMLGLADFIHGDRTGSWEQTYLN